MHPRYITYSNGEGGGGGGESAMHLLALCVGALLCRRRVRAYVPSMLALCIVRLGAGVDTFFLYNR